MAWEIVEELMIGSTKYTWNFPSELKNIILSEIESYGNPNFSIEITSQIPNHSMHDWTIVDYPFTFHKGSDGSWQGGTSYTIGLGTYSIPSRDTDGVYYELTNNHRAGVNYINNTNGTMVVFFAINESAHQAAIMYLLSSWYLSSDMNRIDLTGSGTNTIDYEQFYSDLLSAIPSNYTANGGGATHIAKRTGQLKNLSSYTSDILIVSGGGGGGLLAGETSYTGKEAGGISGSGDNSADQSTGNAFGLGESGTNLSGGGSGLYGGYKGTSSESGGAGSGYIGNSLLSNKKMVGYNVPTSSAEGTKTESVNEASATPVSGKPKSGNGFARIKLVKASKLLNVYANADHTSKLPTNTSGETNITNIDSSQLQYLFTNMDILTGQKNAQRFTQYSDSEIKFDSLRFDYTTSKYYVYLGRKYRFLKANFKYKKPSVYDANIVNPSFIDMLYVVENSGTVTVENSKTIYNSDNQIHSGVISDYTSIERDYTGQNIVCNYICFISMNSVVYYKDLELELLEID